MADVASDLKTWSATSSSNSPTGATAIGTNLDDNLREIQKVVRQDLATKGADIASAGTTDLGAVAGVMHDITGTTTITSFGTVSAGIWKFVKFEGALTLTHNATSLILPGGANITTADGDVAIMLSEGSGNWRCMSYVKATGLSPRATQPTRQVFTSGSGTYTTPTGATRINVRIIGGGGGGGAAKTNAGSAGGQTTFSTMTGNGGTGGATNGGVGGAGGVGGSGDINMVGGAGDSGSNNGAANSQGGGGGNGAFGGGGGMSQSNGAGQAAGTNTGGGGGGGGDTGGNTSGAGGGAGGYSEKLITSPSATYSYGVGAGGNGGSAGTNAGGNGAAGIIIVDEWYN
jgi:hypothetical protein